MMEPITIVGFDEFLKHLDTLIAQNSKTFKNDAIVAFLGGFSGAFFAFVLNRFNENMDKKRDRYIKHKNAMVKMEYALVKHQDKVNRLTYLLRNTIKILQEGHFTHNRFAGLNIVEGVELELGDINLINEVSNYWLSVERVNNDCDSLNRILETLQEVAVSGRMPNRENFVHLTGQMDLLIKYLDGPFLEENVMLNAYVRILLERVDEVSELGKFMHFYKIPEPKIPKGQIKKVRDKIYKEMTKRREDDSIRLSKL